jgi:hypothetical protein
MLCRTCGADWSKDEWTKDCCECGGGALEIDCPACGGKCGAKWTKATMDTGDSGVAHWCGNCLNPVKIKEVPIEPKKKIVKTIIIVSDDGRAPIAIEHFEEAKNCYIVFVEHEEGHAVTKADIKDSLEKKHYRNLLTHIKL